MRKKEGVNIISELQERLKLLQQPDAVALSVNTQVSNSKYDKNKQAEHGLTMNTTDERCELTEKNGLELK